MPSRLSNVNFVLEASTVYVGNCVPVALNAEIVTVWILNAPLIFIVPAKLKVIVRPVLVRGSRQRYLRRFSSAPRRRRIALARSAHSVADKRRS